MKVSLLYKSVCGALGVAMFAGYGLSAYAQENNDEEVALEEVVITGSRIARPSLESSTPLLVISEDALALGAEVNVGEYLNQLPSVGTPLFNRTNSNFDVSNSGVVNVDLRDLGVSRTLTLVNGRRFVAGVPGTSAVDLNAIPSAMIKRVEVTTGGASAVYGSDAVAGVLNFILKDDFEGVDLSVRSEVTGEGDGEEFDLGLLIGSNFSDDRGNATVFLGYTDQGAVFSRDRDRTDTDAVSAFLVGTDGIFAQQEPFFSSFPPQGRFDDGTGSTGSNWTYQPDGTFVQGFNTNGGVGADGIAGTADDVPANGFNRMAFRTIAIPTERFLMSTNVNYDFSEDLKLFFEGTYTNTKTTSELEPFPLDSADIFVSSVSGGIPLEYEDSSGNLISHPFMPAELLAEAQANAAAAAADDDPNTIIDGVRFRRRLAEFGGRGSSNERQTFRFSTGLAGEFSNEWTWDASYTYGKSTQAQISQGQVDITAFKFALLSEEDPDNPGSFRCVDDFARALGCSPINVFGFDSVSAESLAYVSADQSRIASIEQKVFQANLSGDLFELPAGAFAFAAGVERRQESSEAISDALTARGLNSSNAIPSVTGKFDVTEFYAEVNIPIIADKAVDYLGLGIAGRTSDYSTVGSVSTFEGRLDLKVNEDVLIRASSSQAVRAPNIDELFDPGGQTFAQVNDPCDGITAADTGVVAENCLADPGIAARVAADGVFELSQTELQGTTGFIGGNPNLAEETATSSTVGLVYTPSYLPKSFDLSVAVDYWDIKVEDAIFAIEQNSVLDLCYNSAGLSSPLCNNIVRFDVTNTSRGALDEVNSGASNVGEITTSGMDFDVQMDFDLEQMIGVPGSLSSSIVYTYLNDYDILNQPGAPLDQEAGEIGNARNKLSSTMVYTLGDFNFMWQVRYIDSSRVEDTDFSDAECASQNCFVGSHTYSDIQARYKFDNFANVNLEFFAGVENVFDKAPPILSAGLTDSDTGTETAAGVYDAIGRAYYIGFTSRF